ncbi:MAG: peptidase [Chloroflexi bacterium]|nr:peptidase [Chloroflexota bacterium]|tara:strand:- start:10101 stop:12056 length:1956 start_codon:yes stop_codon:yes gene_type:complete
MIMKKKNSQYGSWLSPLSAKLVTSASLKLSEIVIDGDDIYWLECRANEGGRYVIVKKNKNGKLLDVSSSSFNVRNSVHEYGGGSYDVKDGVVYFCNWDDQRIYKALPNKSPIPITSVSQKNYKDRYADLRISNDSKWIICVRERHQNNREPENQLVAISTDGVSEINVISKGYDFYSSPRLNNRDEQICWLSWNHPNMPWDGCELWSGIFDSKNGRIIQPNKITGDQDISIVQPEWSPKGELFFISDESGWWNLTKWTGFSTVNIISEKLDHGGPSWQFGFKTFCFNDQNEIILSEKGLLNGSVRKFESTGKFLNKITIPHNSISYIVNYNHSVIYVGSSPNSLPEISKFSLIDSQIETIKSSNEIQLHEEDISYPKKIKFPTTNNEESYAFYYAPKNSKYQPIKSEKPPLLVISHGGPTSSTSTDLNLSIQYWTTRGFSVVDVDYRGSTGYGKKYRNSLKGNWGIFDTDDCVSVVKYLSKKSLIDINKVAIKGGSAGGYTTINALTFHDVFAVGASYYGIADLSVFINDTHKFESKYLDSLIGPYPEKKQEYYDRSAINFTERLSCPMIILQGTEDKIVPPSQAEIMAKALREKKIPFTLMMFKGEQHGFRDSKNIIASLEAELYFYSKVMKFIPSGEIKPIVIENSDFL